MDEYASPSLAAGREKGVRSRARVQLRLLGRPELTRDGVPVRLATRKATLLLARLVVEGPQSRESLATLLWPEADDQRSRASLRRALAYVRDGFGRDLGVLIATGGEVALGAGVETDLNAVRSAIQPTASIRLLSEAVDAWRGELLEGILVDEEELDAWLAQERASWSRRLAGACERLIGLRSQAGDWPAVVETSERWLARDPLAETAHRELIRGRLMHGDRTAALEAYRRCAELLRRDLGIEPSASTRALAEQAETRIEPVTVRAADGRRPEVPMLGREREHALLVQGYERVDGGAAELALVRGEAGIGKTRLVQEFARWVRTRRAEVLAAAGFPAGERLAYHALRDALPGGVSTASHADQRALFEAAADRLELAAGHRPLVLLLDDLQWVDADSLELLAFAAARLSRAGRRFLLVVTAREEDLSGSTRLREWLARATHDLPLFEVRLHPLSPAEAARVVEQWPDPTPRGADRLPEVTGGRPLLLIESLRYLAAGGDPDVVAPGIRESMLARLAALPGDAARLAGAAAVVERPASLAELAGVGGVELERAAEALEQLLSRRVLEGDGAYAFSHEMLRQCAYGALGPERRRTLHRAALEVLSPAGDATPAEFAHHAELAGELERALDLRLRAAEEAMAMPAYRAAAEHFRAAIAIRPGDGAAWLGLGRAEELSGRSSLAAGTYRMLAERARAAGDAAEEAAALVRLAELAGRDLTASPPNELFEEAGAAAAESEDEAIGLEARLAQAQVLAYHGELRRAGAQVEAAEREARHLGRQDLVARCLNLGAFVHQAAARWQAALPLARAAASAYRELGEPLMRLDSIGYEVAALVFLGRWREALRRVVRPLEEARRLGNPWAVCNLSLVEAWALRDGGRLNEALASARRGLESGTQSGFEPLRALNGALAGRCLRELGDVRGALVLHSELMELAGGMDGVMPQCVAEELVCDHAALGDWEEAARCAGRAIAAWGEMRMFAFVSLWVVADARLRSGARFITPKLPAGKRYDLVRLRTQAVVARHSGSQERAIECLREALGVAKELELPVEVGSLREDLASQSSPQGASSRRK